MALPQPGTPLPPLVKPRWTSTHVLRWLAAQQNWDRIHFDQRYCSEVAQLPAPVINGALKQHLIMQFLAQALPGCWPWRVDYRFAGPDYVGEQLRVQGEITETRQAGGHTLLSLRVEIVNVDGGEVTTHGHAVVIAGDARAPVRDALAFDAPADLGLPCDTSPADATAGDTINRRLGTLLETRTSHYPIDLSRLRLFADAVIGLPPQHYDPDAGAASAWGGVVAPPLFPLHALEALPGTLPLSEDGRALGREGVNEVGRDLAGLFGLASAGGMNAGNRVELHSLARVGERVRADCTLVAARRRHGTRGGDMYFFETLNRYVEVGGRPLVSERQTVVVRMV